MTEALWRHALGFLDRHGARAGQHWEELYEFSDKTGILERHKQLLARPGHSAEVTPALAHFALQAPIPTTLALVTREAKCEQKRHCAAPVVVIITGFLCRGT